MIPPVFSRVQVLGVDEHMWHCQDRRRRDPRELTGIMTLTRGKDHPTARLSGPGSRKIWHRVQEQAGRARRAVSHQYPDHDTRPPPRGGRQQQRYRLDYSKDATSVLETFHIVTLAGDVQSEVRRRVEQETLGHRGRKGAPLLGPQSFARLTHAGSPPRANKNASVRPSWQMRCISVSKSPTTAPSKCARSSTKIHPPKANTWPHTSLNAYQPAPSPKSPDWARPYASGRTHSTPTSTQAEPATHPTEAINGHYRTGQTRHIARGYHNPTNYQPRMPLTTAGLDTSPTPNYEEPINPQTISEAFQRQPRPRQTDN